MSALGRNIGNFVLTFSKAKTSFKTANGLRTGLLSCCGSTVQPLAKDSHHSNVRLNVKSNYNGIRTELYNNTTDYKVLSVRQYSNKIQATPTPKSLLSNICDNEIAEFSNIFESDPLPDPETYLKETGFELTRDNEYAVLTKKFADGTEVAVRFDVLEDNSNFDEAPEEVDQEENENDEEEEEEEQEEEQEEEEQEEDADEEEQEDGEEEEQEENSHDHGFEVQITKAGSEGKITFGCYAEHDGSYVVSGFYKGGFKESTIPVDISGTTPEFQENILLLLQQYGIDERLALFVHDYVHTKRVSDYIDSFKALKEFVEEK